MNLTHDSILELFRSRQAVLDGHFLLSSGLHSPTYLQCARVLCWPEDAAALGRALAERQAGLGIEAVASPALGGLIIGHEVARALGVRHIFGERAAGIMQLRRGFEVRRGERFLVVEDVLTTGGSTREVLELIRTHGGVATAAAAIVHRGAEDPRLGIPFSFLLRLEVPTFPPEDCPLCRRGLGPAVKPGSRGSA